jgi:hypothetical protein
MDVKLLSPFYLEHVSRTTINLDSKTVLLSRNDSTLYNFSALSKRLAPKCVASLPIGCSDFFL